MSTIRRHGVAFHLIPTPGDSLWLEVIRESDGAILASEEFRGESADELAPAVDEYFADIVHERITQIQIDRCRACGNRRRPIRRDDEHLVSADYLVEWEFDVCMTCAAALEAASPWMRSHLEQRYHPDREADDW